MRNHIAFKCIAVLLCAVSLLGSIGSGLGILALTEMGLYSKTMDQFLDERIQGEGSYLARNIATRYASMELGGIPEDIAFNALHAFSQDKLVRLLQIDGIFPDDLNRIRHFNGNLVP